jgi:hypothetical protein
VEVRYDDISNLEIITLLRFQISLVVEKARKKQSKEGDANTCSFYLKANGRRQKYHIHRLRSGRVGLSSAGNTTYIVCAVGELGCQSQWQAEHHWGTLWKHHGGPTITLLRLQLATFAIRNARPVLVGQTFFQRTRFGKPFVRCHEIKRQGRTVSLNTSSVSVGQQCETT